METKKLFEKYNVPAPRYDCYPAFPYWDRQVDARRWVRSLKKVVDREATLYLHMPFCESLCRFCGFDKRITQNHYVEDIYIEALIKHWELYLEHLGKSPLISQLYMGGGTPTFFSPENLEKLYASLLPLMQRTDDAEMIFEGHPNNTNENHLRVLYDAGFKSVSYGVQDFNEQVLKIINRIQPLENVENAVAQARRMGYRDIKFDLIYGLPGQTTSSMKTTMGMLERFMPDIVAFYSYIHIPWEKPNQSAFRDDATPQGVRKSRLLEAGQEILQKLGYVRIGADHYVRKNHRLHSALKNKTLSRNFTGYTARETAALFGLGAMAVSETQESYAQNTMGVEDYHDKIFSGELPIQKTHFLTKQDQLLKGFIHNIECHGEAQWSQELFDSLSPEAKYEVIEIQKEGLIDVNTRGLKVTRKGWSFLRNISMVFDARHHKRGAGVEENQFSLAI